MPRLSYLLIPALLAIGLYLGINTLRPGNSGAEESVPTKSLNYDAWSEGINTVLYNEQGAISYTLQAERQFYLKDDSAELENPIISLYQPSSVATPAETGRERWQIVARSGTIFPRDAQARDRDRQIELTGDVRILGRDEFGNETLMQTERLLIDPTDETARTDAPVSLQTTRINHSAVGMVAELGRDRITFLERNTGSYEPIQP